MTPAASKGSGCLACPILPTIRGVKIGYDYKGGAPAGDANSVRVHRMPGRGVEHPKVLIVLDNPGGEEDENNDPATSREADRIISAMESAGIVWRGCVRFTYAVRCHGQGQACVNTTALKACNVFLSREVAKTDPDIVVPIGSTSLRAIVGPSYRVDSCHGSPFKRELAGRDRVVFPMFSPGTLFYREALRPAWNKAWANLARLVAGKADVGEGLGKYVRVRSAREAAKILDGYTSGSIGFDFETNTLDPFDREVSVPHIEERNGNFFRVSFEDGEYEKPTVAIVSWSAKPGTGYYVVRDHAAGKWKDKDRRIFDAAFRRFILRRTVRKIPFNAMFESLWCRVYFNVVLPASCFADAMMTHALVDEEASHSLANAATQFTGMGNWKQTVDQIAETFRHNYRHIPLDIIGPYAGADSDATLRLSKELEPRLDKKRQCINTKFYPRLIRALSGMTAAGAKADEKYVVFYEKYTRRLAHNAGHAIRSLPTIKKYIRRRKREDPRAGKSDEWTFNLNSPVQVKEILYGELGYEPLKYTSSAPEDEELDAEEYGSSDKDSLRHFIRNHNCDFCKALLLWRANDKQHGTYAVGAVDHFRKFGGFIRGGYRPAGTKTGRLSSSGPNLQNQPQHARRLYVSRWGRQGVLISADYSQIEVRVAASLANEKLLLDAYRAGKDVHFMTMCRIFGYTEAQGHALEKTAPKGYKTKRTIAKRIVFGVLYGIGAPGIVNTLRMEEVIIDEDEAQEYIDKFFGVYRRVRAFIDDTNDYAYDHGYTLSPFGRRRHLPDIRSSEQSQANRAKRQGPNAVVQGTASDLTLTALILISEELAKRGLRAIPVITVHDSIVVDSPIEEAEVVSRIVLDIMENLSKYAASIWGLDYDWSWMRCPIVAEVEIGYNWRDGVKYGPGDDLQAVLKKADEVEKKEDRKYADLYMLAKVSSEKYEGGEAQFIERISGILKPGRMDGTPLEKADRSRLRNLAQMVAA